MKYVKLEAFQIRQLAVLQISLLCTGSTTLKQAQSSVFSVTHTYPDKTPYISTLVAIGDKESLIEEGPVFTLLTLFIDDSRKALWEMCSWHEDKNK